MIKEPSDIVELLARMAVEHDDATCATLHSLAKRGEPILNVCFYAIVALAGEKATYFKQAVVSAMLKPLPPIVINKDKQE